MIRYHATHVSNLHSIQATGLETARSTGKAKRVWMVPARHIGWAIHHAAKRHGWEVSDMVVIELAVETLPIVRHPCGAHWCPEDVPADCIVAVSWCGTRFPKPHYDEKEYLE